MPVPKHVRATLAETDTSALPGTLSYDRECAGAKFHSPTPLLLTEVALGEESVWLCGTCCDNLRVLQHLLAEHDGDLPWTVRREFGNLIRAIALRSWEAGANQEEGAQSA